MKFVVYKTTAINLNNVTDIRVATNQFEGNFINPSTTHRLVLTTSDGREQKLLTAEATVVNNIFIALLDFIGNENAKIFNCEDYIFRG